MAAHACARARSARWKALILRKAWDHILQAFVVLGSGLCGATAAYVLTTGQGHPPENAALPVAGADVAGGLSIWDGRTGKPELLGRDRDLEDPVDLEHGGPQTDRRLLLSEPTSSGGWDGWLDASRPTGLAAVDLLLANIAAALHNIAFPSGGWSPGEAAVREHTKCNTSEGLCKCTDMSGARAK
jgi:hypothetical protein